MAIKKVDFYVYLSEVEKINHATSSLTFLWRERELGFKISRNQFFRSEHDQCDQIGRFSQVIGNKFSDKMGPNNFVTFWAISSNVTSM